MNVQQPARSWFRAKNEIPYGPPRCCFLHETVKKHGTAVLKVWGGHREKRTGILGNLRIRTARAQNPEKIRPYIARISKNSRQRRIK
jgi:hypothetical protein